MALSGFWVTNNENFSQFHWLQSDGYDTNVAGAAAINSLRRREWGVIWVETIEQWETGYTTT